MSLEVMRQWSCSMEISHKTWFLIFDHHFCQLEIPMGAQRGVTSRCDDVLVETLYHLHHRVKRGWYSSCSGDMIKNQEWLLRMWFYLLRVSYMPWREREGRGKGRERERREGRVERRERLGDACCTLQGWTLYLEFLVLSCLLHQFLRHFIILGLHCFQVLLQCICLRLDSYHKENT